MKLLERMDPRKQFSKKLAGRAEWFWIFYLVLLAALLGYRPESYLAVIILAALVTVVMVTSVLAYTDNSKYEKGLYAPNQLAKILSGQKVAQLFRSTVSSGSETETGDELEMEETEKEYEEEYGEDESAEAESEQDESDEEDADGETTETEPEDRNSDDDDTDRGEG